jgi:hypothetical protein
MKHKKSVLKILSANSECFRVSVGIAPNLYIGETNLRIYTQNWVDWRRFVSLYCCIKYNNFFLQIIKRTFYLLNTFRTNMRIDFSSFAAIVT